MGPAMRSTSLLTLAADHLWQSVMLALVLHLAFCAARGWSAAARCRLALAALGAAALLPLCALLPQPALPFASAVDWRPLLPRPGAPLSSSTHLASMAPERLDMTAHHVIDQAGLLLVLWGGGALILLIRTFLDYGHMVRLIRGAAPVEGVLAAGTVIATSAGIAGPMVVCYRQPLILLPHGFENLEVQQLRALLAHEEAHILRGDMAVALLQRLVGAVFWWSPALHWINARIDEEREMACDAFAASAIGDPVLFARALVEHARGLVGERGTALAMSATRPGSRLAHRVGRLLRPRVAGRSVGIDAGIVSAFVGALLCLALATPRLMTARSVAEASPAAAASLPALKESKRQHPAHASLPTTAGQSGERRAVASARPITPNRVPAAGGNDRHQSNREATSSAQYGPFDALTESHRQYEPLAGKYRGYDRLTATYSADRYPSPPTGRQYEPLANRDYDRLAAVYSAERYPSPPSDGRYDP